ncbi:MULTISPECIES: error-prone DNA polymerase [unclassified Acidovorax]|uniref:error-prone DNA polymerase n=3 Tax=Acidovorax TaxID=12916 RepID=UPI0025B96153|nr:MULTISPECIES: error-prone DNA polymerase [unclassified Acidovorax]HQS63561.1 error-prone DNA polymerase [Acidovorax defluvii]HQT18864.1 error-prone DNA polymerase [Acidovorax defluvii]HQT50887.1 error-prone DNA polymerase [Acidovorax defluvii]
MSAPSGGAMPSPAPLPGYAELHCLSNFSFQRGASHPKELVARAAQLGYQALALTDECSVAGVVRAWEAAKECGLHLIVGSEFVWGDLRLVALARDAQGWGNLCEFITAARAVAPKGQYHVGPGSPFSLLQGCELLLAPCRERMDASDFVAVSACLSSARAQFGLNFDGHLWLAVELHLAPDDSLWLATLQRAGAALGLPLVAAGDVHMHARSRKPLQDVITAVQRGCSVAECGFALQPNAERHLRQRVRLAGIYPPELLAATLTVAARCTFSLGEIRYQYPLETVPSGMTPAQALAWLAQEGAMGRYPQGVPDWIAAQIRKELALIAHCQYEMYFLTVHDIVRFARSQGILCQGRGSAANSVVCYVLGITAVAPEDSHLLFERFISKERSEPPDIDVDFEHDRREEVIQYIYAKYGRDRAAITAVVTTYRTRSALRDVGKALGVAPVLVDAFAKDHHWFDEGIAADRLQELAKGLGVPLHRHTAALWLELAAQLKGFPRHLSQHVGGFVLTQGKLTRLVPVEPASMEGRSVIQWDKDDLDTMGLLKVDVLALGMLSALRRCLQLRAVLRGEPWGLADIPREDAATYDMICAADTVGVFQIESRAQMSMLPRLQPRVFYDLVVQVAIVRPGPIQGGMVHPYLQARERRRHGQPLELEKPELEAALARTLGVPIFQEQVMQIAMIAAGFGPGMADDLRRSMAAWKRKGGVHRFERPLIGGMEARGYRTEFAQAIFQQMLGFGEYGFPESHAHSFALLSYASSWLKCHEPACFLAALLNSLPMGFYSASQLVQDARRHGVRVLPIDVTCSDNECTLEGPAERLRPARGLPTPPLPQPAVRLGLCLVSGLHASATQRLVQARAAAPFTSTEDLALRAQLSQQDLQALAAADALASLSGHRRQQMWEAAAQHSASPLWRDVPVHEAPLELQAAPEGEEIMFDYAATGLTLRRHPLALLRPRLARWRLQTALQLHSAPNGRKVRACGIVTMRQRPGTAKGTMFVTLEDETGPVNVIVWPALVEHWRQPLLGARLLAVEGVWQCSPHGPDGQAVVRHLVAQRFKDLTPLLGRMAQALQGSRDFH